VLLRREERSQDRDARGPPGDSDSAVQTVEGIVHIRRLSPDPRVGLTGSSTVLQDATARLASFGTMTCMTPHATIGDAVAAYQILTSEPDGYETLGANRGRERSTWMTPVGSFQVEQEFAQHPADGRTLISGPAELRAAVAWRFGRQGSYLRTGVDLELDGRQGVLVRPSFGVRSARRQVLLRFEDPPVCWSVRARTRRFELSRARQVVGRHGGVTELAVHANPRDAAVAILLTVNDVWSGSALWARTGVVLDGL
jgi:hypothetical protein